MKYFFLLFLLLACKTLFSQDLDKDSLITHYRLLEQEIVKIEFKLDSLEKVDDSIFKAITFRKEKVVIEKFNYRQFLEETENFKEKYKQFVDSENFPTELPLELEDKSLIIGFGNKIHPTTQTTYFHTGIDFPIQNEYLVKSTISGFVEHVQDKFPGFSNNMIINSGSGIKILYVHLDSIYVKEGQKISNGQLIGAIGLKDKPVDYGLHYGILIGDEPINPIFTIIKYLKEDDLKCINDENKQTID